MQNTSNGAIQPYRLFPKLQNIRPADRCGILRLPLPTPRTAKRHTKAAEQVVEVWRDGEMIGCFYAHAVARRRFIAFISKHLTGARMDTRDLAAPDCIMALQSTIPRSTRMRRAGFSWTAQPQKTPPPQNVT